MSGIAGYLGSPQPPSVLRAMTGKMMHRGPAGDIFLEEAPVFIGVRQFVAGNADPEDQVFVEPERDLAVAFSGELFNVREEREALERRGARFAGNSAAEVVLRLYDAYGVSCVNRMRGAFVFAVHDQQKALVFIARDQTGLKPLYYATTQSGTFVFASEVKALFEHPSLQMEPDLRGVDAYLSLGCSPGPDSMFKGVHKLPPGHRILWNPGLHVMIEPYWQWDSFAKPDPVLKTDDDFRARFAMLFEEAVRLQQGDGASVFIDGSPEAAAIAVVMAKNSSAPLRAFCLDADGTGTAAAMASRLGATAETVAFGPHDMDKLSEIIWALDEPVADISVAPQYLASRVAQKHSNVALSALGGAQMFVSLPVQGLLLDARKKPPAFYRLVKSLYSIVPQATLAKRLGYEGHIGPRTKQRLFDFVEALRAGSLWQQYLSVASIFDGRDKQFLYAGGMQHVMGTFADLQKEPDGWPSDVSRLFAIENMAELQEGGIAASEKLAMFSSLEQRLPFMDHRLAEFLAGLPDHLRRADGRDRVLLRDYLDKTHPGLLQAAPKPALPRKSLLAECLASSPLKEMIDICLSETSVRRREIFDWKAVKTVLDGAKTDEKLYSRQLFALLTLEIWFRIFIDHEKGWMSH